MVFGAFSWNNFSHKNLRKALSWKFDTISVVRVWFFLIQSSSPARKILACFNLMKQLNSITLCCTWNKPSLYSLLFPSPLYQLTTLPFPTVFMLHGVWRHDPSYLAWKGEKLRIQNTQTHTTFSISSHLSLVSSRKSQREFSSNFQPTCEQFETKWYHPNSRLFLAFFNCLQQFCLLWTTRLLLFHFWRLIQVLVFF